jgi:enhancing lycopene biosynthesis protein 2
VWLFASAHIEQERPMGFICISPVAALKIIVLIDSLLVIGRVLNDKY